MNTTNTNTNNNARIRPRPLTSTSTNTSTNTSTTAPFSEYVLFPPNINTSTSLSLQNQNPFVFQSGIPAQNLAPAPATAPTPFHFEFPLTRIAIEEDKEKEPRNTAFDLSIEESEQQKKTKLQHKLAKKIEKYIQENPDDSYCLTRYTLFEIDGIQADVYIGKEAGSYFYHFVAKNVEYVEDETNDDETEFLLTEKNDFDTVVDVLEHIEKVRDTYTFLDFYLLSPEKKEAARMHRTFLPLHKDKMCSVCYEPTIEYTTCKHPICLKCREKCIVNDRKMCPVCRSSSLRFYPTELAKL